MIYPAFVGLLLLARPLEVPTRELYGTWEFQVQAGDDRTTVTWELNRSGSYRVSFHQNSNGLEDSRKGFYEYKNGYIRFDGSFELYKVHARSDRRVLYLTDYLGKVVVAKKVE